MTDKETFLAFCHAQLGKPYQLGDEGPDSFDCSGLIYAGLTALTDDEIPRLSTDQYTLGKPIDPNDATEGDLIFFDSGWIDRKPNHDGICTQSGKMINANGYYNKILEEPFLTGYWQNKLWGARRIFAPDGSLDLSGDSDDPEIPDFEDVPQDHSEYEFIMELRRKGVIQGFPGNLFKPEQQVTRAEALKIILLVFEIPIQQTATSSFSDIHPNDWYISIVETAKNHGIINGYPDGTFKPNDAINRAEISKIILETGNADVPPVSESKFSDVPLDAWFCAYVHEADIREMFVLIGNIFLPNQAVTRGEMCRAIIKGSL